MTEITHLNNHLIQGDRPLGQNPGFFVRMSVIGGFVFMSK